MAVDIYIDSQIVVQTAAQWAADNTVYSEQRILVTSDEVYTGTDQRKFKIANGTDTWANLDYFPTAPVISVFGRTGTVTAQANDYSAGQISFADNSLTNPLSATDVDGALKELNSEKEPTITTLPISKGGTNSGTALTNNKVMISSGGAIVEADTTTYPSVTELSYVKGVTSAIQTQLNGKQATLTNPVTGTGTNNEIAAFNGTSTITSLSTATYPSLTELSYVKGVTSSIQTQLNAKTDTFTINSITGAISPADNTTYYFGLFSPANPTTVESANNFNIGYAFTVIGAVVQVYNNTVQGSAETGSFQLRNTTQGTSTTIVAALASNATSTTRLTTTVTGLSISVAAGDSIALQFNAPNFSTNPTNVVYRCMLICTRS